MIVLPPPENNAPATADAQCAQPKCLQLREELKELIDDLNTCGYGFMADRIEVILERSS